ncbi:MFS transporter [Nonomuraea jiangxiensis]|uniref:Predicted arabinose efflux permease, MFS family n=1 Tax=Nonomuraea jiangxiensis TaxID=633440 RepID=A0A1G8NCU3_9ACTN|nr:MFS transporter [Nonomuraea jiangxiensis]SDI77340.1 Predicted arabinose efflux permease, MFS family [Nonomuraea jiangxiensis]
MRVGRLPAAVALGSLFNPLNSSMIAVALVDIEAEFRVGLAVVTWLAAGFYLVAILAPPLMGVLADRFGARRVFCAGLVAMAVTGVLAALAPSYPVLLAVRLLQAFGSCATMPAGMAILARPGAEAPVADGEGRPPPRVIAMISMVLAASAAVGPVLSGFLVSLWGWRAIFLVNVPLAAVALVVALRWLPEVRGGGRRRALLPRLRPGLLATCGQFALANVVFYLAFFAVPLWAQRSAGVPAHLAGLLVLPMAALGIVATPLAVALAARAGLRAVLVLGAALLVCGSCVMLAVGPLGLMLTVASLLGVASAFSQFGLNSLVFVHADGRDTGVAVGVFQASRYVGAGAAASLVGVLFAGPGLEGGGWTMAVVSAVVLVGGVLLPVRRPAPAAGGEDRSGP